jgi:hypothetical protein
VVLNLYKTIKIHDLKSLAESSRARALTKTIGNLERRIGTWGIGNLQIA